MHTGEKRYRRFGFFFFSIQAHSYTSNLALHLDEAMNDLALIN